MKIFMRLGAGRSITTVRSFMILLALAFHSQINADESTPALEEDVGAGTQNTLMVRPERKSSQPLQAKKLALFLQQKKGDLEKLGKKNAKQQYEVDDRTTQAIKDEINSFSGIGANFKFFTFKESALVGQAVITISADQKILNFLDIKSGTVTPIQKDAIMFSSTVRLPSGASTLLTQFYSVNGGYQYLIDGRVASATKTKWEGRDGSIDTTVMLDGQVFKLSRPGLSDDFRVDGVATTKVLEYQGASVGKN